MRKSLVGYKVNIVIPNPSGESFEKIVMSHGESGHVYVSKKHIGKTAVITVINYTEESSI
jgi:putative transposon-encoded protein